MLLPADLITEETIATLYDHLEGAAETARALIESGQLEGEQLKEQYRILDGWAYCQKGLLGGVVPYRER